MRDGRATVGRRPPVDRRHDNLQLDDTPWYQFIAAIDDLIARLHDLGLVELVHDTPDPLAPGPR